jgi:ArsR family transcriptional regulator
MIMNSEQLLDDPFTQQADYFKALAHPVRLQILAILLQGESCVCHIMELLDKRQAYISQQLSVLKQAGLVGDRKDGLFVYYALRDPHLAQILAASQRALDGAQFERALSQLTAANCACSACTAN